MKMFVIWLPQAAQMGILLPAADGRQHPLPSRAERTVLHMKKLISLLAAAMLLLTPMTALADGDSRIVFGKDLTSDQKAELLKEFDVSENAVETLTITIDEEKAYLADLVPADKIGSRSLSSIYIQSADEGSGIDVTTHNINWVTADMYTAALTTAGIKDANIKVASPVKVSGTAALAGIFKAYEDITGETLDDNKKEVAGQELVLTGDLGDVIGDDEATVLINELKKMLDQIKGMSDEEVREQVLATAKQLNVTLTDEQVDQIVALLRKLANSNIDPDTLLQQAKNLQNLVNTMNQVQEKTSGFAGSVARVWTSFTNWISSLFGGK